MVANTFRKKNDVIKHVPAKEVWKQHHNTRIEEQCMSPFIIDVLDDISKITGYELEVVDTEVTIGDFRADIVCKDSQTGEIIIIENQLESSDHSHLGKSLTYLSNLDAKAIIWICEAFRPEHRKAIEKLNEITAEDYHFYALELRFEKYGTQDPYYDFNQIVIPSDMSKLASNVKTPSIEAQDISKFLEGIVNELKPSIPSAHANRGRSYCKIGQIGSLYLGIDISTKTGGIRYQISTNKSDDAEVQKLDSFISSNLNNKHSYSFKHTLGTRDKSLNKWYYEIQEDRNSDKGKDKILDISRNIYNEVKLFKP